jgi:hypothetical protein
MKWLMKVFLLAAAVPLLYLLAWHLCRITNLYWSNSLNIPAFVMLIMAEPWTSLVVSFDTTVKMNQLLGHGSRKLVQELVLIIGFAVNITLGAAAVRWVHRIILVSRRLR